jgi:hypothetical protein
MAWLPARAEDIENGTIEKHPEIQKLIDNTFGNLPEKWKQLEELCRSLESLAHTQLRGVEFSESESLYIENYGKILADLMFYAAHARLDPRDDAPRIVDVYTHIDDNDGRQNLEVGVARPRELLVLYPWKGKTYLCRGAVMPYYEFTTPTRLNDADWKTLLDSDNHPSLPKWFAPLVEENAHNTATE